MTAGTFGELLPQSDGYDAWDPSNVAPMVVWLASADSARYNGQIFVAGGGVTQVIEHFHVADMLVTEGRGSRRRRSGRLSKASADRRQVRRSSSSPSTSSPRSTGNDHSHRGAARLRRDLELLDEAVRRVGPGTVVSVLAGVAPSWILTFAAAVPSCAEVGVIARRDAQEAARRRLSIALSSFDPDVAVCGRLVSGSAKAEARRIRRRREEGVLVLDSIAGRVS